ncbi:MAG TPA: hypothetical protein VF363_02220 [Candidatus Eisenbacteria bacterium]
MPIEYHIDHSRRLVVARGRGTVTSPDIFGYQREVWSRADVVGYDELVDMSDVAEIVAGNPVGDNLRALAAESASTDPEGIPTKFAIVAGEELAFGLGRMYQAYRALDPRSTKRIEVFRTLPEALAFLGVESLS